MQVLKNAYLDGSEDANVIGNTTSSFLNLHFHRKFSSCLAVDWGEIANDQLYMLSVMATRNVGENVARVIEHMVDRHNVSLEDVHIIGHSLGAHAGGHIGMYLQAQTGKKLGRITGLGKDRNVNHQLYLILVSLDGQTQPIQPSKTRVREISSSTRATPNSST